MGRADDCTAQVNMGGFSCDFFCSIQQPKRKCTGAWEVAGGTCNKMNPEIGVACRKASTAATTEYKKIDFLMAPLSTVSILLLSKSWKVLQRCSVNYDPGNEVYIISDL